jgi:hypothetical protein
MPERCSENLMANALDGHVQSLSRAAHPNLTSSSTIVGITSRRPAKRSE